MTLMWNIIIGKGKVLYLSGPYFAGSYLEGAGEGGLLGAFSKTVKNCPNSGKNPNCGHL